MDRIPQHQAAQPQHAPLTPEQHFIADFRHHYPQVFWQAQNLPVSPGEQFGPRGRQGHPSAFAVKAYGDRMAVPQPTSHLRPRVLAQMQADQPAPVMPGPGQAYLSDRREPVEVTLSEAYRAAIANDDSNAVRRYIRSNPECLQAAFLQAVTLESTNAMSRLVEAGAQLNPAHPAGALAWQAAEAHTVSNDLIFDCLIASKAEGLNVALSENPAAVLNDWLAEKAGVSALRRAGLFSSDAHIVGNRIETLMLRHRHGDERPAGGWPAFACMRVRLAWTMGQQGRRALEWLREHPGGQEYVLLNAGLGQALVQKMAATKQAQARAMLELWTRQCAAVTGGIADFLLNAQPLDSDGHFSRQIDREHIAAQLKTLRGLDGRLALNLVLALEQALLAASGFADPVNTLGLRTKAVLSWCLYTHIRADGPPDTLDYALAVGLMNACANPTVEEAWIALHQNPVRWLLQHEDGLMVRQYADGELITDCLVIVTGMPAVLAGQLAAAWKRALDALVLGCFGSSGRVEDLLRFPLSEHQFRTLSTLLGNGIRRGSSEMHALHGIDPKLAQVVSNMHGGLLAILDRQGLIVPASSDDQQDGDRASASAQANEHTRHAGAASRRQWRKRRRSE